MTELTIEHARTSDLRAIVALIADDEEGLHSDSLEDFSEQRYRRAFDAVDSDPRNELYVAREGDRTVGTMQITFIPHLMDGGSERAFVEALFVARESRGRGIGGRLLEFACLRAQERGCNVVELHSNRKRAAAHRFYERHGFEPSHFGFKRTL